jgi:hypothetical protein
MGICFALVLQIYDFIGMKKYLLFEMAFYLNLINHEMAKYDLMRLKSVLEKFFPHDYEY